jgi:hypothetical protein
MKIIEKEIVTSDDPLVLKCVFCKKQRVGYVHFVENSSGRIRKSVIKYVCGNIEESCPYAVILPEKYIDQSCGETHVHIPVDKNLTNLYA